MIYPFVAGALSRLAIYNTSREGQFAISLVMVVFLGTLGGGIARLASNKVAGEPNGLHVVIAFVVGAFISESIGFVVYYIGFGHKDVMIGVSVAVALLEFSLISIIGGLSSFIAITQTKPRII